MILGISTSLSQFCITLTQQGSLIFHSQTNRSPHIPATIDNLLLQALEATGASIADISSILVDIGPGGTSSVRTGVSFANGLSYSRNIPILGVSSAELMGIEAYQKYKQPVAVLFKSIRDHYYLGLYDGKRLDLKYMKFTSVCQYLDERFATLVLAGHPDAMVKIENCLERVQVTKSKIHKVDPYILSEYAQFHVAEAKLGSALPTPITEAGLVK